MKKNSQNRLHMKKRLFRFDFRPSISMNDHITSFNQLVANLLNLDETFKDEDLALMLLSSLPDEFEYLKTTLLHGKYKVSLDKVYAALCSYELRKKDKKESRNISAKTMVARYRSQNRKPRKRGKSHLKTRLEKDECVFCYEERYWKKDCPS